MTRGGVMVKGGDVLAGGVDSATLAQEIATPYHHFRVVRPRETIEVFRVFAGRSGSRVGRGSAWAANVTRTPAECPQPRLLAGCPLDDYTTSTAPDQVTASWDTKLSLVDLCDESLCNQFCITIDFLDIGGMRGHPFAEGPIRDILTQGFSQCVELTLLSFG